MIRLTVDEERALIREALQKAAPRAASEAGISILTAWVVVAEWQNVDGDKTLTRLREEGTTTWMERGMLHECLADSTDFVPEEDD